MDEQVITLNQRFILATLRRIDDHRYAIYRDARGNIKNSDPEKIEYALSMKDYDDLGMPQAVFLPESVM